jgi:single-strand DNA-binding protein
MAGETTLTLIGNLTADPDLRFTPNGVAVANFTVASTPRTFDRQSGEWKPGEALFLRCTVWREQAEYACETLSKGTRVIVCGRLVQRAYQTRDGDNRTSFELQVEDIGPSLRYTAATLPTVARTGSDAVRTDHAADEFGADQWPA